MHALCSLIEPVLNPATPVCGHFPSQLLHYDIYVNYHIQSTGEIAFQPAASWSSATYIQSKRLHARLRFYH